MQTIQVTRLSDTTIIQTQGSLGGRSILNQPGANRHGDGSRRWRAAAHDARGLVAQCRAGKKCH